MKLERGDFALFWNLECGLPEAASCYIYKKDLDLEGCFFLYSRFTPYWLLLHQTPERAQK